MSREPRPDIGLWVVLTTICLIVYYLLTQWKPVKIVVPDPIPWVEPEKPKPPHPRCPRCPFQHSPFSVCPQESNL